MTELSRRLVVEGGTNVTGATAGVDSAEFAMELLRFPVPPGVR